MGSICSTTPLSGPENATENGTHLAANLRAFTCKLTKYKIVVGIQTSCLTARGSPLIVSHRPLP